MLKYILKNEQNSRWLWLLPESLQNRAEMLHERWLEFSMMMVKNRHKELVEVKKNVREWAGSKEMAEFSKKARLRYLKQCLASATAEFEQNREQYIELVREGKDAQNCVRLAEELVKRINGYKRTIDITEGKIEAKYAITDEMVERAREYPIENLLEVGQNRRAKCCFHQGEGWNMDIRKNYAHCYVCGETGDVIKVYRKLHDCGFQEAVLALQ